MFMGVLCFFGSGTTGAVCQSLSGTMIEQAATDSSLVWTRNAASAAADGFFEASSVYENEKNYSSAAASLRRAAEIYLRLGDVSKAKTNLTRSLELETAAGNRAGRAETHAFLAYIYSLEGRPALRDNHLGSAIALRENLTNAGAIPGGIDFYAGEAFYSTQDLPNLLKHYSLALKSFEGIGDTRGVAKTLLALSYAAMARDDPGEAAELAAQAISIWNDLGEKRGRTLSLIALGLAQFRKGESDKALNSFREAEEFFPSDVDNSERAVLIYNTGRVYESFGACDQAIDYYRQSLFLLRVAGNRALETGNLWTLGSTLSTCERNPEEAFKYTQRALELGFELKRFDDVGSSYTTLGEIYLRAGDSNGALENYLKAYRIFSENRYFLSTSRTLVRLGQIYERIGRLSLAKSHYTKSLHINGQIRNEAGTAEALFYLGTIEFRNGNYITALKQIRESLRISEKLSSTVANSNLKIAYNSNIHDRYEMYVTLLMRSERADPGKGYALEALKVSENARARSMLEDTRLSQAKFLKDAPVEKVQHERRLSEELNRYRNRLTEMLSANTDLTGIKTLESEMFRIENQLDNVKAELRQSSPVYSAIRNPDPFDPRHFRENVLDDDSVFLEFSLGEDESYLWIIDKNEITHHSLPSRVHLESKITALLESLKSREQRPGESIEMYNARVSDGDHKFSVLAAELSWELLGQAAEKLKGKRLIVSPDGKMSYLPLSALPFPNSNSAEPLIATNEIIYTPSASILALLKTIRQLSRPAPTNDVIVFADPVFTDSDERLGGRSADQNLFQTSLAMMRSADSIKGLGRLPASETEAESIAGIAGNSTIVLGFAANRGRVLSENLQNYKVIHFATHGIWNEKHPDLSGILLSLYDDKGAPSEGFIRTQDIYGLDLNADLVVLSACNSGVGKDVRGEGIMSFNSAFMQAGARSVVSSLWKVDDTATEKLMREFYGVLATEGTTPAQALRTAQLKMIDDPRYRSPFYWAAFTVQGDTSVKITFSSWKRFYWGLAIGIGIVGLLVLIIRYNRYKTPLYSIRR